MQTFLIPSLISNDLHIESSQIAEVGLNYEIVGNGFGWWYEQYAKKEIRLKALQAMAKEKRLGLW